MSNASLIAHIKKALERLQGSEISAKFLADVIRNNGRSLEGIPYNLVKEMEDIAGDLEIADWDDEEYLGPTIEPLLLRTHLWLRALPPIT